MTTNKLKLVEYYTTMELKRKDMEPEFEDPIKRPRIPIETIDYRKKQIINSTMNLNAILNDEFYDPTPVVPAYVGKARDVKLISKIIATLNEKIPLKELAHLKRARKQEVLLCPTNYLNSLTQESIQDYIEEHVLDLKDSFEYFKIVEVPALPSKLKCQHLENGRKWSGNFHPNPYLEKLFHGIFFKGEEIKVHRQYMAIAYEVAKFYLSQSSTEEVELSDLFSRNLNASVVVDPAYQTIVAVAFDNRESHPSQHSAMLAIDNVAKTQNGGAWGLTQETDLSLTGIDKELYLHLKNMYPRVKFGARTYISKSEIDEKNLNASENPYLCTGYYIYLIKEPCVMCAMGLVHGRVNRVFYDKPNELYGALGSVTKLHCVPSLNHHFEVFTRF